MTRSRLERFAPLTGIAFVALFIAAFAIGGETPSVDDPIEDVVSFWQDNESETIWGAALLFWGSILAVWFGASVRSALRIGEVGLDRPFPGADRLATLAFAGWVLFGAGALAFAGFGFALGDAADEEAVTPEAIQALSILSEDFFPLAVGGLALAMLATAVATLRYGGLPRWLGFLALVIGIVALTPIGFFAFMASGIWVVIASVLLYRTEAVVVTTPPAAGPPPPGPPPAV
jgi:hypothetical protein